MSIVADSLLGDHDFLYTVQGAVGLEHWDTEAFEEHMRTLDVAGVNSLTCDHFSTEIVEYIVGAGLQVEFLRAWKSCMTRKIPIVRTGCVVKALLKVVMVDMSAILADGDIAVRGVDRLCYLGNCTICMRVGPVGLKCPNPQCGHHHFVPLRFDNCREFAVDDDVWWEPMGDPVHRAKLFGHRLCDVVRDGNMYRKKYQDNDVPMQASLRLLCHRLKCRPGSRKPAPILFKDRQEVLYELARAIGAKSAEAVEPLFASNVGTSAEDVRKNLEAAVEEAKGAEWQGTEWRMSVSLEEVMYYNAHPDE